MGRFARDENRMLAKEMAEAYQKEYQKEYRKSDKYKAYQREYQKSDKCKAYRKAYRMRKKRGGLKMAKKPKFKYRKPKWCETCGKMILGQGFRFCSKPCHYQAQKKVKSK